MGVTAPDAPASRGEPLDARRSASPEASGATSRYPELRRALGRNGHVRRRSAAQESNLPSPWGGTQCPVARADVPRRCAERRTVTPGRRLGRGARRPAAQARPHRRREQRGDRAARAPNTGALRECPARGGRRKGPPGRCLSGAPWPRASAAHRPRAARGRPRVPPGPRGDRNERERQSRMRCRVHGSDNPPLRGPQGPSRSKDA